MSVLGVCIYASGDMHWQKREREGALPVSPLTSPRAIALPFIHQRTKSKALGLPHMSPSHLQAV